MVILCAVIAGVLSLVGGIILVAQKNAEKLAGYAAAFAAGALLATVAFDLLPHIGHEEGHEPFLLVLAGILVFFLLELILNHTSKEKRMAPLIVISDFIHNIIDGAVIAAGFLISVPTGVLMTLTVVAHEVPHEVGDFGLLLHHGVSRKRTLLFNALSAACMVVAAGLFFAFGEQNAISTSWLLGLASGFFLYVAFHVLLDIHHAGSRKAIWAKTGFMFGGLIIVGLIIEILGH